MSIINEKYRAKYTGEKDWFGSVLDDQCYVSDGGKGRAKLDLNKLFDLAKANGIDAAAMYGDQVDRKNAAGRLRMTIGNRLRPIVRAGTGFKLPDGEVILAPAEWLEAEKNRRPVREAKPKVEKTPAQGELFGAEGEPEDVEEEEQPAPKKRRK